MITVAEIKEIVSNIKYNQPGWQILVLMDGNRPYLQVRCSDAVCNVTGEPHSWSARKWFLSQHMCRSEIIRTAHKAIEAAVLHEMNENFTYKGVTIFDPHMDLDALVQFRKDVPLDSRENSSFENEKAVKVEPQKPKVDWARENLLNTYLENLRSGKYKQCNGTLKSGDSFCALGVWYDTAVPELWDKPKDGNYTVAKNWFGDYRIIREIYTRSDSGHSFPEIADWLETQRQDIIGHKS